MSAESATIRELEVEIPAARICRDASQPVLALHISPPMMRVRGSAASGAPEEIACHSRSSSLPTRAIVAPMVHYIESLHHQRTDLTLTAFHLAR